MTAFPLFIDLSGKKILIFGGGAVALRKIRTLLLFHPSIEIYAKDYCEELLQMISERSIKEVELVNCSDGEKLPEISGAFMVICATDNDTFNHRVAKKCQELDILVNSATNVKDCSFIFPAVTVRGDIVCGISSSGSVPVLTKKIREDVDAVLPQWYDDLARCLENIRSIVKEKIASEAMRKSVLQHLAAYGMSHCGKIPEEVIRKEIEKTKEVL